jgi:hypothetical protein
MRLPSTRKPRIAVRISLERSDLFLKVSIFCSVEIKRGQFCLVAEKIWCEIQDENFDLLWLVLFTLLDFLCIEN